MCLSYPRAYTQVRKPAFSPVPFDTTSSAAPEPLRSSGYYLVYLVHGSDFDRVPVNIGYACHHVGTTVYPLPAIADMDAMSRMGGFAVFARKDMTARFIGLQSGLRQHYPRSPPGRSTPVTLVTPKRSRYL